MIPSITQSLINCASLAKNWGTLGFTSYLNGYNILQYMHEALKECCVSFIQTSSKSIPTSPSNTCLDYDEGSLDFDTRNEPSPLDII